MGGMFGARPCCTDKNHSRLPCPPKKELLVFLADSERF